MAQSFRYAWPASQLTPADMRQLYAARESHPDRLPITELVARAVRAQYGHLASKPEPSSKSEQETTLRPAA